MRPFGCFGSSLACAPQTAVCSACAKLEDCEALVLERRPQVMNLLARFANSSGVPMSHAWLTPKEKRDMKDAQKAGAKAERERQVYGDPAVAQNIKSKIDKRTATLLDRMTKAGVNVCTDGLPVIACFDNRMGTVIRLLQARPHTMQELTAQLAAKLSLSDATAQREVYSRASILVAADRAKRVGATVELT